MASHFSKLMRLLMFWICFSGLSGAAGVAGAADKPVQNVDAFLPSPVVNISSIKALSAASKIFASPVYMRGTLGKLRIKMYLQPHADYEESVQGNYSVFGKTEKIMLAGELQGDELSMEESVNGSDVSGQWSGRLEGSVFRGTWYSDAQSRSLPFDVTIFSPEDANTSVTTSISKGRARRTPVAIGNKAHHE